MQKHLVRPQFATGFQKAPFGRRTKCHQPDPVRLPQPAPGSATPTSTVHAFFRCTRWLSTFHRGARPVFTRPSKSEREHDLSSKALSFSKERMRKRDRQRVRASMTGESSRACFSWLRFIADDDDDDDIYLKDSPTGTKPWSRGSP